MINNRTPSKIFLCLNNDEIDEIEILESVFDHFERPGCYVEDSRYLNKIHSYKKKSCGDVSYYPPWETDIQKEFRNDVLRHLFRIESTTEGRLAYLVRNKWYGKSPPDEIELDEVIASKNRVRAHYEA